MTLQSPTATLIPLFSSSELTGFGYPGLLDRKNRSDMCHRWESNPRLPACKASTLSTRPGSPPDVKIGDLNFYMGTMKIIYFSKTIAAYDLKVGRCIEINDLMNLYENRRSRSFIDLRHRSLCFQTFNLYFLSKI